MEQYNNVEYQNLIAGIKTKNRLLTEKNEEMKECAENAARFKREYAIEFAKKILVLKSEGQPATLIRELANGDDDIAELRFKKDVHKGLYEACKESIRNIRLNIDSYRSLLGCEKAERFNRDV